MGRKAKRGEKGVKNVNCGNDTSVKDAQLSSLDSILSNCLIMDQLLPLLEHADLLNCSLVSKSWNSFARVFLFRRGKTLLSLQYLTSVEELEGVAELMEQDLLEGSRPFRGLKLVFTEESQNPFNAKEGKNAVRGNQNLLQRIFAGMEAVHVTLNSGKPPRNLRMIQQRTEMQSRSPFRRAPVNFPIRVYNNYAHVFPADTLTSLRIEAVNFQCANFVKLRKIIYPNLKLLDIYPVREKFLQGSSSADIKKLLSMCPALEWQLTLTFKEIPPFIDMGKVLAVKSLEICDLVLMVEANVAILETAGLRLTKLLCKATNHVKNISAILAKVIGSSAGSLEEIWIYCMVLKDVQDHQDFPCLTEVRKIVCVVPDDDDGIPAAGADLFQTGRNPCLERFFPRATLEFY